MRSLSDRLISDQDRFRIHHYLGTSLPGSWVHLQRQGLLARVRLFRLAGSGSTFVAMRLLKQELPHTAKQGHHNERSAAL